MLPTETPKRFANIVFVISGFSRSNRRAFACSASVNDFYETHCARRSWIWVWLWPQSLCEFVKFSKDSTQLHEIVGVKFDSFSHLQCSIR